MSVTIAMFGQVMFTAPPCQKDIEFMAQLKVWSEAFRKGKP